MEKNSSGAERAAKTFRQNASEIFKAGKKYFQSSMLVALDCRHPGGTPCDDCRTQMENLHYFGIALTITADAVGENRAEELHRHLTGWAKEHLPEFPSALARDLRPASACETEFPEIIGE